jgi:hypothetical protein
MKPLVKYAPRAADAASAVRAPALLRIRPSSASFSGVVVAGDVALSPSTHGVQTPHNLDEQSRRSCATTGRVRRCEARYSAEVSRRRVPLGVIRRKDLALNLGGGFSVGEIDIPKHFLALGPASVGRLLHLVQVLPKSVAA